MSLSHQSYRPELWLYWQSELWLYCKYPSPKFYLISVSLPVEHSDGIRLLFREQQSGTTDNRSPTSVLVHRHLCVPRLSASKLGRHGAFWPLTHPSFHSPYQLNSHTHTHTQRGTLWCIQMSWGILMFTDVRNFSAPRGWSDGSINVFFSVFNFTDFKDFLKFPRQTLTPQWLIQWLH